MSIKDDNLRQIFFEGVINEFANAKAPNVPGLL